MCVTMPHRGRTLGAVKQDLSFPLLSVSASPQNFPLLFKKDKKRKMEEMKEGKKTETQRERNGRFIDFCAGIESQQ